MAIPYSLVDNKLTAAPTAQRAQVRLTATARLDDLAEAVARPGSTVTKAEFLALWEELSAEVERRVLRGESVVTDLFTVRPALTGVWDDPQAPFDPQRHRGRLRLAPGVRLRRAEAALRFEQEPARDLSTPLPQQLEDFTTDVINGTLTRGGAARLTGGRLKFDPADPEQGLFLLDAAGAATRITRIITNLPAEQLFMVPDALPAGAYQLEVRRKARDSRRLRTALLAASLQVG